MYSFKVANTGDSHTGELNIWISIPLILVNKYLIIEWIYKAGNKDRKEYSIAFFYFSINTAMEWGCLVWLANSLECSAAHFIGGAPMDWE